MFSYLFKNKQFLKDIVYLEYMIMRGLVFNDWKVECPWSVQCIFNQAKEGWGGGKVKARARFLCPC